MRINHSHDDSENGDDSDDYNNDYSENDYINDDNENEDDSVDYNNDDSENDDNNDDYNIDYSENKDNNDENEDDNDQTCPIILPFHFLPNHCFAGQMHPMILMMMINRADIHQRHCTFLIVNFGHFWPKNVHLYVHFA